MKKWKAKIKEKNNDHILTPEYSWFANGEKTRQEIIEFWGLENDDVEWYELEMIDEGNDKGTT